MLASAVESYLAVRHAAGFALRWEGSLLRNFATFSDALGRPYVCSETAIQWAGLAKSLPRRARRLGNVIRFARHARAKDPHTKSRLRCLALKKVRDRFPISFPARIFSASFRQRLNRVATLWVERRIPRCLHYWHALDCGCRKPSASAMRTSPRMV